MEAKKVSPDFCLRYCYAVSYEFPSDNSSVFSVLTIQQLQSSPLLPQNCSSQQCHSYWEENKYYRKTNIIGRHCDKFTLK